MTDPEFILFCFPKTLGCLILYGQSSSRDLQILEELADVTTFENVVLRIDCNKAEEGLRTTPGSQCSLNAL